jgi:hypothetical protein
VATGQFGAPDAEAFFAKALIERRDAIARAYLPAVNPVIDPSLDAGGTLTFGNAAVAAGLAQAPAGYRAEWFRFDNTTGESTPLGRSEGAGARLAAPAAVGANAGPYVRVDISATGARIPAWERPVRVYFRRTGNAWTWVGFDRMPS